VREKVWFDPPTLRWRPVLAASAAVSAIVSGWIVLMHEEPRTPVPAAERPLEVAQAAVPVPRPAPARPLPTSARAAPKPALAANETAVCGGYVVRRDAQGNETPSLELVTKIGSVRQQALAAMRASADPMAQAVALLTGESSEDVSREGLAQLAFRARDPGVYGLAMQVCQRADAGQASACGMLSTQVWAQLDPDNAAPWLWMASEAAKAGNVDGEDDAMNHAARARRNDLGYGRVVGTALNFLPQDEASLAGSYAWAMEVVNIDASLPLTSYNAAGRYCGESAVRDPNRRQVCGDVAELLFTRSTTLLDRSMGAAIGRRVGWPAERLDAGKKEREAMTVAQRAQMLDGAHATDCAQARRSLQLLRDVSARGELQALRGIANGAKLGGAK